MPHIVRRPVVGIRFDIGESGTGDAEHIQDLLFCLNLLKDEEKPSIILLSYKEESYEYLRNETKYPYLDRLRERMSMAEKRLSFDLIFPTPVGTRFQKTLCWFSDFQDKYLPDFFTENELKERESRRREYYQNYRNMLFSSTAAYNDFCRFYPESRAYKYVLPLAVRGQIPSIADSRYVLHKYQLEGRIVYCASSTFLNINHETVVDAVGRLAPYGIDICLVFVGRDPGGQLQKYAVRQGLGKYVRFLDDIPRQDRVSLARQAVCVVHTESHDGWSIAAEEAKLVSQYVLAARTALGQEQFKDNAAFFELSDVITLAELMGGCLESNTSTQIVDYRKGQIAYAKSFMTLLVDVSKNLRNYAETIPDEIVRLIEPYRLTDRFLAEADFYGAADNIASKLGYEKTPISYSTWRHGCSTTKFPFTDKKQILWHADDDRHLWSNRPEPIGHLLDNKVAEQFLLSEGVSNVKAVGLPIVYVDGVGVQRRLRSVLLMPAHSINTVSIDNRSEILLIDQVNKLRHDGYYVAVCLHQDCRRDGDLIKALDKADVDWFSGAYFRDMNSLPRMRNIFEYFEIVGSDVIGSHFYYSQFFGAKFYFYAPYFEYKKESFANAPHFQERSSLLDHTLKASGEIQTRQRYPKYFHGPENSICDKAMAEDACGKPDMVDLHTLAKFLGWQYNGNQTEISEWLQNTHSSGEPMQFMIGQRQVGDGNPCFITYEAGPTHDGFESAKALVKLAADAGADAVKFQIFDVDKLVKDRSLPFSYDVLLSRESGETETVTEPLYDILRRRQLSYAEWVNLKRYSDSLGLAFFATVGDEEDIALLVELGCHSIKVASADVNHFPLLRQVARTGMCIQLDTGNATLGEIEKAVEIIRSEGNENIIIHNCPSGYPARLDSINLQMLKTLKAMFGVPVAYSDHTPGMEMDIAAVAMGANLVEKTITLDRTTRSVEHIMSLEPHEIKKFVQTIRDVERAIGAPRRVLSVQEYAKRDTIRRSTVLKRAVTAGSRLSDAAVYFSRPGYGLRPDQYEEMLDCCFIEDLPEGTVLTHHMLKP